MSDEPSTSDVQADPCDPVLDALGRLSHAIRENSERNREIVRRIAYFSDLRSKGRSYTDIVLSEPHPLIVEMTTDNLEALMEAGCRLRRAEAAALHQEGLTMDHIADLFGVTRQRISQLLASK